MRAQHLLGSTTILAAMLLFGSPVAFARGGHHGGGYHGSFHGGMHGLGGLGLRGLGDGIRHGHRSGQVAHRNGSGFPHDHGVAADHRHFGDFDHGVAADHRHFSDFDHRRHEFHHHNQFFFGFGYPLYGFGPFGYWPYYYYPGYYGSFYNVWPYYDYDPYSAYPGGSYITSNSATSNSFEQPEAADHAAAASGNDARSAAYANRANTPQSDEFAAQGVAAFKRGDYAEAVREWRHAIIDEPKDGILVLRLAQALFATGDYNEAAGATQQAMLMLPQEKWGTVVQDYGALYGNTQDYTNQLRALEKAVQEKPKDPAMRFLLGFQYGYLGYPVEATRELDQLVKLAPRDHLAHKLYDLMASRTKAESPHVPSVAAAKPTGQSG